MLALKQTVLSVARVCGLAAAARRATAGHLRILCYHGLWITPGYDFSQCTFIAPELFEARMGRLKASGLPLLPLGDAVDLLARNELPPNAVAVTIDDGWVSSLTHMLPILERHRIPATLYATTWYSGRELPVVNVTVDYLRSAAGRFDIDPYQVALRIESLPVEERLGALRSFGSGLGVGEEWLERRQFNIMSADELAEAHRRGLDVQLHTHRHIDVGKEVELLPREVAENRAFLEKALGKAELIHFCYPSGTFHPRAPSLLKTCGVISATSCERGLNAPGSDPYALRRLLDSRLISELEFDAYLSGVLHFLDPARSVLRPRRRQDWRWHVGASASAAMLALTGSIAAAE